MRHARRLLGSSALIGALALGLTAATLPAGAEVVPDAESTATATPTPSPTQTASSDPSESAPAGSSSSNASIMAAGTPYGDDYPVTLETNFSRPYKAISSSANSDFSLLNDLERLIRGTYIDPRTNEYRSSTAIKTHYIYMSISRMENSHRVGRELIRAAKKGVKVRVIHGVASQSKESRALQSALNSSSLRDAHFKICQKGSSDACLSSARGAIMHSKILLVNNTFTRDKKPAKAAIWSGSANLGGPSGERTYNNGLTVYNDKKLWVQTSKMWADMSAERYVGNDYLQYVENRASTYGLSSTEAAAAGYEDANARDGMFYSNLANVTIYATPIAATPTNNRDPVLAMLKRIEPDDQCRIRLQQNRFKYRRIAVAQKLVELANQGCKISIVAFQDDLKVNRIAHCQQYLRVCRPILDVFKTANNRIEAAWAKPHDKTILVDAKMVRSYLNPRELTLDGYFYPEDRSQAIRTKLVQAGSAALTGSNLIVSDEITTETTDPSVYDDYLEHWKAISKSYNYKNYPY